MKRWHPLFSAGLSWQEEVIVVWQLSMQESRLRRFESLGKEPEPAFELFALQSVCRRNDVVQFPAQLV
jgi:hypothetical protein